MLSLAQKKLSEQQAKEVLDLYTRPILPVKSTSKIADSLNISQRTVTRILERLDVSRPRRHRAPRIVPQ